MKRMLSTLFVGGLMGASTAFAGSITITGTGQSSAAPECATVSINVSSICYDTSTDAKNANAKLASDIMTTLQKYKTHSDDSLTATGGANVQQTETEYTTDAQGNSHAVTLCRNKWRANNTLTLKTASLDSLSDIQDAVLGLVDQTAPADSTTVPRTSASLSQPQFDVESATRLKLRSEAQHNAYEDAMNQFQDFDKDCHFKNPTLQTVAQPTFQVSPAYDRAMPEAAPGGNATPISPDSITVTSTWQFVVNFDGANFCSAPSSSSSTPAPAAP